MRKSLCRLLAKSVLLYLLIFLLRSITRFLLLEELKSVECLQPASRCCKEIADFVTANPDPLIPTSDSLCKYSHSSISCDSEFQSEVVKDDSLSKVLNDLDPAIKVHTRQVPA
ncbi:uncharacterized protein LOC133713398 isoform X2 [Rosa rugosa]|uniref:uncharacterized protein LOC133713398 isoform X2 n=1 Tax=Rosa rugosa TaxID=74645 RepID=UPI002B40F559|nr:uncharacterized protein LOC133713398 isoform X2 [Rosa rugosa]